MEKQFSQTLIENLPVGMGIVSLSQGTYTCLFINEIATSKYGLDKDKLPALMQGRLADFVHPDNVAQVNLMLYKSSITGGKFSEIIRLRGRKGTYIWTELRLDATLAADGTVVFHFIFINIDAQKASSQNLGHTYEELLGVMNNTPGGIIIFETKNDRVPYISLISAGMYRMLEGTHEEVFAAYGANFYDAIHPDDRGSFTTAIEDSLRKLSHFEITLRLRTLKNNYILVNAISSVVLSEGRRHIYMAFSESSENTKAQALLKQVMNMFVRQEYDCIGIIDCKQNTFHILSTNDATKKVYPDESSNYERDFLALVDQCVIEEDRPVIRKNAHIEQLLQTMSSRNGREFFAAIRRPSTGELRYKRFWINWLDKESALLAFVQSDYTEIHQKEIEHQEMLRSSLRAAEQANVAKSVFLSRMSHDIRTPLSAIIGYTNIILENDELQPQTKTRLEKIESSSEFLLSLINDVLEMSRIESGKYSLQHKDFSLSALVDGVISIIGAQCETKKLQFHHTMADNAKKFYMGDQLKLQQVLVNILGNSVKFTPEGGILTLHVEEAAVYEHNALLRFTMSDTGIGIAEDFLPHLFDSFAQENNWDSQHTGSGLGLAICKNIVTLMNGTIDVQSEKGKGTVFTVDVQLDIAAEQTVPSVEKKGLSFDLVGKDEYSFSGKHILLAEDHPMNREIATYILESIGFTVDAVENGQIGCDKFAASAENHYAAIILDIRMPVMDGLTAASTIRAMQRSDAASMPLIAMSANAFEEDISKSLASGINAHLAKPINPDQLIRTLYEYIS